MKRKIVFLICALAAIFAMYSMFIDAQPQLHSMEAKLSFAAIGSVYTDVWTGEVVGQLKISEEGTFLDGIDSYDQYVGNNVIHLVEAGIEPDVLINNTTYPIPIQDLTDTDISITLDKFQTKVTPITDDELYAISYDKMDVVKTKHSNAITRNKLKKAIHAFAPSSSTNNTPVIFTSDATKTDDATSRVRLTLADIIAMKNKFDIAEVPVEGRRIVLCSDHVNDLLLQDQNFKDQYYNYTSGKIANLYGFEVYEYVSCPFYTTDGAKKSLGSIVGTGEFQASIAFHVPNMFKAKGDTKMYWAPSENDPEYQRNKVNFRHMFIALPKTQNCIGAIASAYIQPNA